MADATLKKLRERLRTLEAEIDSKVKLAEGLRLVIADYETHEETEEGITSGNAPKELRNTIAQIMREEGRPLHYKKEIYERLKDRGVVVRGKDPARNIIAHMSQDDRFKNVGRGMWALASLQGRNHHATQTLTSDKEQSREVENARSLGSGSV